MKSESKPVSESSVENGTTEATKESPVRLKFEKFSATITRLAGRPVAFISALLLVIVWAVCGPFFHYSETWQLVINTSTTIITFLMVFLIQQAQNKDTVALHLKLNELIAASKGASNRLINIEDLDEAELVNLKNFFVQLSSDKENDDSMFTQHSIDEQRLKETVGDIAEQLHEQINSDNPDKGLTRNITIKPEKPKD